MICVFMAGTLASSAREIKQKEKKAALADRQLALEAIEDYLLRNCW